MAKMLVSCNPRNDRLGCVTAVKPDTHVWGRKETKPDFIEIKITDLVLPEVTETALKYLMMPALVWNLDNNKMDQLCRRRYRVDPEKMTEWMEQDQWSISITENQLADLIVRCTDNGKVARKAHRSEITAANARLAAKNLVI